MPLVIPLPLAVDTPTVLLAIEVVLVGESSPFRPATTEVLEVELQSGSPPLLSHLLADLADHSLVLVGADEQGGGEGVKAHIFSGPGRFGKTQPEAVPAALRFMPHHPPKVINHVIAFGHYYWQAHCFSQGLHCLQAVLVLGVGVDIGVIPESAYLVALLPPIFDGVGGAVGAAAMD